MKVSDQPSIVAEIFENLEEKLKAELQSVRSAFKHSGLKGSAVEGAFREIFRTYLPEHIGVDTGILVDSYGNESRQMDIICFDKAKTPKFFSGGGASVFPIECVYFVFEVKTSLRSGELASILDNMRSVKNLQKRAYLPNRSPAAAQFSVWGRAHDHFPVLYGLLSLECRRPNKVLDDFAKLQLSEDVDKRIDCAYILGTGTILNATFPEQRVFSVSFCPDPGSFLALKEAEAFVTFWNLFSTFYGQAYMTQDFDYSFYAPTQQKELSFFGLNGDGGEAMRLIVDYMIANNGSYPPGLLPQDAEAEKIIQRAYQEKLAAQ